MAFFQKVVFIGSSKKIKETIEKVLSSNRIYKKIVGYFDFKEQEKDIKYLGNFDAISDVIYENNIDELIVDEDDINKDLLQDTDILVTTTGNVNVCDSAILNSLKNGAVVCNIGHFDTEIDTVYMKDVWHWEEIKPQVHRVFRDCTPNQEPDLTSKN